MHVLRPIVWLNDWIYMAWQAKLTWAGTFEDLYPYPDSMIGMQPMLFRIQYQSSMPSCAFLGERSSFAVSCKWSNQPIARPRWIRRRRYGKWIQEFFGLGRSKIEMKKKFPMINMLLYNCILFYKSHSTFLYCWSIDSYNFYIESANCKTSI